MVRSIDIESRASKNVIFILTYVLGPKNFDFLARSFARMCAQGEPVDIEAVTGNMSDEQKCWFQHRYEGYRKQAEQDKEAAPS